MIYIEMGNVVSKFHHLTDEVEELIYNELSYKIGGFGIKPQTKHLYNDITHMTYTGLVPRILNILDEYDLKYEIDDKRIKHKPNASFKLSNEFKARDYQANIINRASSREIIQAATGAGKTYVMASLIAKFDVYPIIIVAPKISLAKQIAMEISKFLNESVRCISGFTKNNNLDAKIIVGTPQSLIKHEDIISSAKAIFWDECHNIPANTIFDISTKAINAYYRIGVSATPWRDGEEDILIEAALNIRKPHLSITASSLIAKKMLTPCEINFIPVDSDTEWLTNYGMTYNKAIMRNEVRNNKITKIAVDKFNNKNSTLILISKTEHGESLLQKIKSKVDYEERLHFDPKTNTWTLVGNVEFLSGADNLIKREAVFHAIQDGFCKTLIASTIADEGLDLPRLDTLILAGAGKSSTRAFQRIGRVLRLYPGKTKAEVYDFIDSNETFYKQSMTRKALYETEKLWKINILGDN
jgi:superfamily II DNA or RNA helicase